MGKRKVVTKPFEIERVVGDDQFERVTLPDGTHGVSIVSTKHAEELIPIVGSAGETYRVVQVCSEGLTVTMKPTIERAKTPEPPPSDPDPAPDPQEA